MQPSLLMPFLCDKAITKYVNKEVKKWSFEFLVKSDFSSEVLVRGCSVKKVLLEISQNSQENPCSRVSFLIKLQD